MEKKLFIKDLPYYEQPRAKLAKYGPEKLSNAELLAILIRIGHKEDTAIDVGNRLLAKYNGNLEKIFSADVNELKNIKGMNFSKATQLKAAFELSKRTGSTNSHRITINEPKDVYNFIGPKIAYLDKEHFYIICLDSRNRVIDSEILISVGSIETSIVDPRIIFKEAISKNASSVILVHNHPSGGPEPSNNDIEVTKQIKKAGKILGINVFDHVIIGKNSYESIGQESLM